MGSIPSEVDVEPAQKPRKRIVLCRGQYCNLDRRADKLYKQLQPLIDDINGGDYPLRIKLETANCLSMCGAGPNCLVEPGDLAFNRLDADELRRIVDEYLRKA